MRNEQRQYPRIGVGLPVQITAHELSQPGTLDNISVRGARLVPQQQVLELGTDCTVIFDLSVVPPGCTFTPRHACIEFSGHVVRAEQDDTAFGVFITSIRPDDLQELKLLIDELRVSAAIRCEIHLKRDLPYARRKQLASSLLQWRALQPKGVVQHFDVKATNALLAGEIPVSGRLEFAIWDSSFDRELLVASLRKHIVDDLVKDLIIGGVSWNDA